VRQPVQPELGEAGAKLLEMLAPEQPEDELGGLVRAPARDQGEHQPGQERLVEDGDGAMAAGHASGLLGYGFFSRMSS